MDEEQVESSVEDNSSVSIPEEESSVQSERDKLIDQYLNGKPVDQLKAEEPPTPPEVSELEQRLQEERARRAAKKAKLEEQKSNYRIEQELAALRAEREELAQYRQKWEELQKYPSAEKWAELGIDPQRVAEGFIHDGNRPVEEQIKSIWEENQKIKKQFSDFMEGLQEHAKQQQEQQNKAQFEQTVAQAKNQIMDMYKSGVKDKYPHLSLQYKSDPIVADLAFNLANYYIHDQGYDPSEISDEFILTSLENAARIEFEESIAQLEQLGTLDKLYSAVAPKVSGKLPPNVSVASKAPSAKKELTREERIAIAVQNFRGR